MHPQEKTGFYFVVEDPLSYMMTLAHELALAVETDDGIAVFSGCSHHGTLNILAAVRDALPGRRIKALFGGFHLVNLPLSFTLSDTRE